MTDIELLGELIGDLARDLRPEIQQLAADELLWQPAPEANAIGVTVWHIARGLDFLAVRILRGDAAEDELWHRNGWRERTGYDPHGIGYGGWGVLTGYTQEEVRAIPRLGAADLVNYLDQACGAVVVELGNFDSRSIRQTATTVLDGRLTYFQWAKSFYKGFQAHVGEIVAIEGLMKQNRG